MLQFLLESTQATEALGARLAPVIAPGCIVYLSGDLGAGKTTLVRGLLRALGRQGPIKSPTFTLVETYTTGALRLIHLDLYRLADAEELEFIGLRDFLDGEAILLIEWPERGSGVLPAADLEAHLTYARAGRLCQLQAESELGQGMLDQLPPA